MYDPDLHATTDEERFSRPGETVFEHVHRVLESWRSDPGRNVTWNDLPAELKRDYPEVFGRFDDQSLGTVVSLVWLYLGGKGTVNDRIIKKWFRDAIGGQTPPAFR